MRPEHRLIGFDAREWSLSDTALRGADWKETFFLRAAVEKPLSMERAVWPSLFDLRSIEEPAWTGIYQGLWSDLSALRQHLAQRSLPEEPFVFVAFSVVRTDATAEEIERGRDWGLDVKPGVIDPGWSFFGYEVSDDSAFSYLLTVRTVEALEAPASLRKRWGPSLNRWHLFDEFAEARSFKEYNNQAHSPYAPFFVYGVWLVEGVNGGGPAESMQVRGRNGGPR